MNKQRLCYLEYPGGECDSLGKDFCLFGTLLDVYHLSSSDVNYN